MRLGLRLLGLQTLGKRFKESMPKLKAAISQLKREQIAQYESTGSLEVEGCMLEAGDLKVLSTKLIQMAVFWVSNFGNAVL